MKIKHLATTDHTPTGEEYNVYPRPLLERESFFSLNGKWSFCCEDYQGDIMVPYPPESILSGVNRHFSEGATMIYTRNFILPQGFLKDKVIINFGAVDQECTVYINGNVAGEHIGGYNSFSLDITELVNKNGENTIIVQATDSLKGNVLPYGKQKRRRGCKV